MRRPRVLLIGLGLHARRVHYPILEDLAARNRVTLCAVVDRQAEAESVREYLCQRSAPAPPQVVVPEPAGGSVELPAAASAALDTLLGRERIDTVLVATEPLMHRAYGQWAFARGLHTLVDKPPVGRPGVVVDQAGAERMVRDLTDLVALAGRAGRLGGVVAHRRYHAGFRHARRLVREVWQRTGCPPTSVIVEHGDGEWRMPWEVPAQAYHPFNRGYGVLLHSGYHAIDTALWIAGVADPDRAGYTAATVSAHFTTLADTIAALPEERIHVLLGQRPVRRRPPLAAGPLGEIDARLTVGLQRDGATPTVLSVLALHSTNSRRGWLSPAGRNLYTGNGRRIQESVIIHQGPFQSIRIHAYRSWLPGEPGADSVEAGGSRHWTMQVFRNSSVFPEWRAARELRLDDLPEDGEAGRGARWAGPENAASDELRSAVGAAKYDLITDFLRATGTRPSTGRPAFASELASHQATMGVIGAAYRAWCGRDGGGTGSVTIKLESP
jgi:predicted dehydrogenase